MTDTIFNEIDNCESRQELFGLACEYFRGQGFGGFGYVAPSGAAGPYEIMHHGMPEGWMKRYREEELHLVDPIPAMTFRLGQAAPVQEVIDRLPSLSEEERAYIEAFKTSGLGTGMVIPTYGPLGRPGLIALAHPVHPELLDEMNVPLAAAVAQQLHIRMELLYLEEPAPSLSPREREIVGWLCKGKSNGDIATILGVAAPTVTTHVQRIYAKLDVNDRVSCCAKAMAHHYL